MSENEVEERRIRDVTCPQCGQPFRLVWNNYTMIRGEDAKQTLHMRDCPSGGIYDVFITCPHCDYREEL